MALRSPLGQVKGLGAAGEGVGHWWAQRVTAIALVPLAIWFVASVIGMAGADYAAMRAWIASPLVAVLMLLLIVATFYHAALGLQVIIEDYVHHEPAKLMAILSVKALSLVLGLTAVISVLTLLFKG